MIRKVTLVAATAAALLVLPAMAQVAQEKKEPKMAPEQMAEMEVYMKAGAPGEVHKKMAEAEGTYSLTLKMWHAPGAPAEESTGTATRKMALGGRVLLEELSTTMMGMPYNGQGMFGYDNVTGKHWSTWMDNMSTGLMVSEGTCDAEGACTLTGTWNDAIKKAPVTSRMTTRWTSPTTEVFEMYAPGPDGKETKMMEITYTKKG